MKFTELDIDDRLLKGIEEAGFTTLMPVQAETLVHTLKGRDAYVQSQTGTGKTAVFLITIFQLFLKKDPPLEKKRALVVTPTRELAVQIEKDAKQLGRYLDFTVGCFYGGVGYNNQLRLLEKGVNLIVGTPGRLLDFKVKKKLDLTDLDFVIIDEADRMFDMGFLPDIRRIVDSVSRKARPQFMLFSATLDVTTRSIAREYMKNPVRIEIMPEQVTVDKVTQVLYHVGEKEKINLMLGILKKELPRNALIFTNMKHDAARVSRHLEHNGYKCQHITGDLAQNKRLQTIKNFKAGKLPFLVATDVAARGLHIDDLELIINYDLPSDCENYVHRIGRTARAGKSGKAISLACEKYVYNLEAIENFIGMKIPVDYPGDDLFLENKSRDLNGESRWQSPREARGKKGHGKSSAKARVSSHKSSPRKHETKTTKPASFKPDSPPKKQAKAEPPLKPHKDPGSRLHPTKKKVKAHPKATTVEERLEYYKKKYGDNFNLQKSPDTEPRKPTFFQKIKGFFKKKRD